LFALRDRPNFNYLSLQYSGKIKHCALVFTTYHKSNIDIPLSVTNLARAKFVNVYIYQQLSGPCEVMVFAPLAQLNAVAPLQKRLPAKINLNGGNKT
jgi:hypothetical protein